MSDASDGSTGSLYTRNNLETNPVTRHSRHSEPVTCGNDITAWRAWRLSPRPQEKAVLRSPLWRRDPWPAGKLSASCPPGFWGQRALTRNSVHQDAPGDDCICGVRGVTDIAELLAYGQKRMQPRPWWDRPFVIGRVVLSGRLAGPSRWDDDPPSTLRASYGRLGDLLYVPRQLWARIPDVRRTFPGVDVRQVWDLRDIESDALGTTDPLTGGAA